MTISIFIPGEPVSKGRPRVYRTAKGIRGVTPEKTRNYEAAVQLLARQVMAGSSPMQEAIGVTIDAKFTIPKSWKKDDRQAAAYGLMAHTKRPDIDNVVKAVLDGMSGIVFNDDSQITALNARKRYSTQPGLTVTVWEAVI